MRQIPGYSKCMNETGVTYQGLQDVMRDEFNDAGDKEMCLLACLMKYNGIVSCYDPLNLYIQPHTEK